MYLNACLCRVILLTFSRLFSIIGSFLEKESLFYGIPHKIKRD